MRRPALWGAGYLKIDDIPGESKSSDDKHDKWIDVLSIDWGAKRAGAERQSGKMTIKETPEAVPVGLLLPAVQKVRDAAAKSEEGSKKPKRTIIRTRTKTVTVQRKVNTLTYRETARGRDSKIWTIYKVEMDQPVATGRAGASHEINFTYSCKSWKDVASGEKGTDCARRASEGNKGGNAETTWKVEKGEK